MNHFLIFFKKHGPSILVIILFLISSYFIISSDYNFVHGDAGLYARHAKVLYETKKIDITGTAAVAFGQLFFSALFSRIFGFSFRILHITVYIVNFLSILAMYLLLIQFGVNRFLALFGALTLFINPITLKMIDWYMTEPYFMFYLIFSILFFVKAFQSEEYRYFYIGSLFCICAILTRQHAISICISSILICIFYRKRFKKATIIHCLVSSVLPLISVGLFYLYSFYKVSGPLTAGVASDNIAIIKRFINPFFVISEIFKGSLFFMHYSALYVTPILIVLFVALLINPKNIKKLYSNFLISIISILFLFIGTMFLYVKNNALMPYAPSIFNINSLTKIFNFSILNKNTASMILTLFTFIGGTIVFIKILEYIFFYMLNQKFFWEDKKKQKKTKLIEKTNQDDYGKHFFYLWGILYILITILIGLRYDRYIFPFSVLIIYVLLAHFSWIGEFKKTFLIVFLLIFSVFIFKVASHRLIVDLKWEACNSLLNDGVSANEINGSLGFNHFYSYYYIKKLYKNVNIRRRINWYKFHPMARFFITGKAGLEKRHPGLVLYRSFSKRRLFGFLESRCHIYERKKGYSKPVWI